jgi:hypothetical protein
MINLADILRHCKKGITLYTTVYGEVTFNGVSEFETIMFSCDINDDEVFCDATDMYGKLFSKGECIIFPSYDRLKWNDVKEVNGELSW